MKRRLKKYIFDLDKALQDFEFQIKRSNRLLKNSKSKEQLKQVLSINEIIKRLIPEGTVIQDEKRIEKTILSANLIRENFFSIIINKVGYHLINVLSYMHLVAQSEVAIRYNFHFIYLLNQVEFNPLEKTYLRKFTRLLGHLDLILLSAMEYLLKNHRKEILESLENDNEEIIEDYSDLIRQFILEYSTYLNELISLRFLKFKNLKGTHLVFGPGMYYFRISTDQEELIDYQTNLFTTHISSLNDGDRNYEENFQKIYENFSHLNDLYFDKFGFRINKLIKTAEALIRQLIEKHNIYLKPYGGKIPVFKIGNLQEKKAKEIGLMIEEYIKMLASNYFNFPKLRRTILDTREIKRNLKEEIGDWRPDELQKIIEEITAVPQDPFIVGEQKLANKLLYPIKENSSFIYMIGYPGAIRERLYLRLSEIDSEEKEFVFTNAIKRVLKDNGYKIHPLSGKQILNDQRKTIGEIDIVAIKDKTILFVESKIMLQKKIDSSHLDNFKQNMIAIQKKIIKFDKNIASFKKYCGDPDKLNHFLNYTETKILNLADFEFQYNFFVTPFLIFYPKNVVYKNPISTTSIYLFNLQIKNLQETKLIDI